MAAVQNGIQQVKIRVDRDESDSQHNRNRHPDLEP